MGTQQDVLLSALSPTGDAGSRLAVKNKVYFCWLIDLRNVCSPNVTLKLYMFR